MALKLYGEAFNGEQIEIDNLTNKITTYHDAVDGSYVISQFYVTNDPPNLGYSNIEISLNISGKPVGTVVSDAGIVYQIAGIDVNPAEISADFWDNIPHNNSIYLRTIEPGEDPSIRSFILRTYVPRGTAVNYFTEASINISAIEFQAI